MNESQASEDCLNGYVIKNIIGKGASAKVFTACKPHCIYAIKKVRATLFNKDEVIIAHQMGEYGIGPRVYAYWYCRKTLEWFIVIDKIDGITLCEFLQYNECISQELYNLIYKQINLMHQHGVIHHDLHCDNIMLSAKDNYINAIYIIDYSFATFVDDDNRFQMERDYRHLNQIPICNNYYF
ncbi:MAG TPA: lipopolysaccharide core heptose(II) kinase RfaY [Candidatus Saccharimonadales bacterium]|nr:lipopolysaccharide core heptose(II) kinase RfaY [Candidatus Saccharimonadales bacterium]